MTPGTPRPPTRGEGSTLLDGDSLLARLLGEPVSPTVARLLGLILVSGFTSGLVYVFSRRHEDFPEAVATQDLGWIYLASAGFTFLASFRLSVRILTGFALWLLSGSYALQALAKSYRLYEIGLVGSYAGAFALTAALIVSACEHLRLRQLMVSLLVGWIGWAAGAFSPELGVYRLLSRPEFGLALAAAITVALVPFGFRLYEPESSRAPSHPESEILARILPLLLGIGALIPILSALALLGRPNAFVGVLDDARGTGLMIGSSLPSIAILALMIWRAPSRLALALRLSCGLLIALAVLAWSLPSSRVACFYAADGISSLASALAMYLGVRSVSSRFALPAAAGFGFVYALGDITAERAHGLAAPELAFALVSTTVFLIALLVFPVRQRADESAAMEPEAST